MKEFIKKVIGKYIGRSMYKRNILVMVGGRIIAQAVPILLTPLLTRMYTPAEFGMFGVYASIIALIAMVSNGRYSLSIILPKDEDKAKKLFLLSSLLTIIITLIFALFIAILGGKIFGFLEIPIFERYLLLLILNILFIGLYEPLYYYALRTKYYKILTTNIIIQALILISTRILLGYLGYTEIGLILSYLLGYSFSYILLVLRLKIPVSPLIKDFKIVEYIKLIKEYSNFPRFSLLADTLSLLATNSPNILLNKVFGSVATGYYSMSDKILGSPIWFVTSSVGDVFKQEASEQLRTRDSCFDVFVKTTKTLFLLAIGPFLIIFLVSPYIIPFILGPNWEPVGDIIRIFSIMYFLRFIISPVSYVIYIVGKQKYNIFFQSINLITTIIPFFLGIYFKDLYLCLISFSILTSISYIITFLYSYKFAKESKYDRNEK